MEQLKSFYRAAVAFCAHQLNKVIVAVAPMLSAVKVAKRAGKTPSLADWANTIGGILIIVAAFVVFGVVAGIVAEIICAVLSIFLAKWFASLVATVLIVFFEISVFDAVTTKLETA